MSLYGPADERTEARRFKCGRQLPGAAVGQPMIPVIECQNNQFELLFGQRHPTTNQTPVTSHCIVCHGQDQLVLLMTNSGGPERPLFAAQIPALMAQRANPAMLVCRSCGGFRFLILDEGNELRRRCTSCGDQRHLGYETKVGGKYRRTFA
ncbi:MAG: hypothetical protein Q8Q14_14360 [Gemmatimonadales bacterium]|nr:hypothetical protein [Gemmatimonadales bacterium]